MEVALATPAVDPVYGFTDAFCEALVAVGVRHVVVSPGSRSTPLTLAAVRRPDLCCRPYLDERSAGFFALGLAKASRTPVALICTSGTAAANYLPAVVEAHYARVPLLVLTADRPPELRDWGAGQTIDQQRLYGSHTRWYAEAPVAGEAGATPEHARALAVRAVSAASARPAGPVHLNFPFREPLEPQEPLHPVGVVERGGGAGGVAPSADALYGAPADALRVAPRVASSRGADPAADPNLVAELAELARRHPRGLLAFGPIDDGPDLAEAAVSLSAATGWPVFADAASQLRRGPHCATDFDGARGTSQGLVLECGDHLLRDEAFARRQRPDIVFRFGATPTSKALRLWLEQHRPAELVLVDPDASWNEPSAMATRCLRAEPALLCRALARRLTADSRGPGPASRSWRRSFEQADRAARGAVARALEDEARLLEPLAVRTVASALPDDALLYVSNSMPVRDLDAYLPLDSRPLRVLANRGANGIDGMLSSALGAAAAGSGPVVLLSGDLAFLHDVGGLLTARDGKLPATIVVLDNDGGGIFSFLPVAERAEWASRVPAAATTDWAGRATAEDAARSVSTFETFYRTPHGLDLEHAAALYRVGFERADTAEALRAAVTRCVASGRTHVIAVRIDRDANVDQHRHVRRGVAEALSRCAFAEETA